MSYQRLQNRRKVSDFSGNCKIPEGLSNHFFTES